MDPISLIVTALATGAAAGLKPTAEKVISDAYEGLKGLLKRKYARTSATVPILEDDPASDAGKAVVRERLEEEGAGQDGEVLRQAQALLQAIERHAPETAAAAGVLLEDLKAGANLTVHDVHAEGGFTLRRSEAAGDITVGGIRQRGAPSGEEGPVP